MKHFPAFLISALIALMVSSIHAQQSSPTGFTVHEWGTFTTLTGSDGILLPGLYHEEESLPYFVNHFPGFVQGCKIRKGLYLDCENVTVKMETPVIYFYSDKARQVTVRVDYPGGTISQWYPERDTGEMLDQSNFSGSLDFGSAHNGWIEWNAHILAKSENDTAGISKYDETHTWQAPRNTDANVVTGPNGEVEKFLFYRGVGNANFMDGGGDREHYLLKTSFEGNNLVIKNLTHYNILYGFVFESKVDASGDTTKTVWWSGAINDGAKITCSAPKTAPASTFDAILTTFRDKLVEKGLYKKEADAMIDTWKQSYFGTPGLRVFWIVPVNSTAKTLPMTITPKPDKLERILVARSEVLTPEFEKQLLADYQKGNLYNYYSDRYYLAYQARVQAMLANAGVASGNSEADNFHIYPNPSTGKFTIASAKSGAAEITLVNLLGTKIAQIFSGEIEAGPQAMNWDATETPSGIYYCLIKMNGKTENYLLVIAK